ncbi:hypothetical protein [Paraburkholderia sp. J8-2]|uniref:cupin domain-containing protein n=1 Tax=Paraburkholderia sp. J8-2 TaxID=2805440 RepID=UPI002AB68E3F|nr:hypothetical protein [Paraburkholderia sp. J8-2]
MKNTPIIEFDYDEKRDAQFKPWLDAEQLDLSQNTFFKRGYYYTREEHHGMFAGFCELRGIDLQIASFPVDQFLIVVAGQIEITDAQDRKTILKPRDTAAIPRFLKCRWQQTEGTKFFFMNYEGPSKTVDNVADLAVVVPDLNDKLDPISGPAPELITSSPLPTVGRKIIYTDPTGQFTVGLWEATSYTRKLAAFKDYEIMHFIEGQVEMTNAIDEAKLYQPEQTFLINRGVSNAWKTDTYIRKVYCKLSPATEV